MTERERRLNNEAKRIGEGLVQHGGFFLEEGMGDTKVCTILKERYGIEEILCGEYTLYIPSAIDVRRKGELIAKTRKAILYVKRNFKNRNNEKSQHVITEVIMNNIE